MSSSQDRAPIPAENPGSGYAVVLPCPPDQFADFVSGLLGRPQTISKTIFGTFDVEKSEVSNFFHLVEQRLSQQNESHLVQFAVRIIYDDGSSIELNSHDDFEHYAEIHPVASTSVHLSWTYLVKFRQKPSPEKQQIDVAIVGTHGVTGVLFDPDDPPPPFLIASHGRRGLISFRIQHTARTWGADIEALLAAHCRSLIRKENSFRRFIQRRSGLIGLCIGVILMLSVAITGLVSAQAFADAQLSASRALAQRLTTSSPTALLERIDYIISAMASGVWPKFVLKIVLFFFTGAAASIGLGIWAESNADNIPPSLVTLTKEAVVRRQRLNDSFNKKFRLFVISVLSSVATSVIGNWVFAYLSRR